jgi:Pentapeptide repeats (8 copies)
MKTLINYVLKLLKRDTAPKGRITDKQLKKMLAAHHKWLVNNRPYRGTRNMRQLDLRGEDLQGMDFVGQDLRWALFCCADLSGANLRNADLRDADLYKANLSGANISCAILAGALLYGANLQVTNMRGTIGNGQHIKSMDFGHFPVTYTATHIQIGCQLHPIEDWWKFEDWEIQHMSYGSLSAWHMWKPLLHKIVTDAPATGRQP